MVLRTPPENAAGQWVVVDGNDHAWTRAPTRVQRKQRKLDIRDGPRSACQGVQAEGVCMLCLQTTALQKSFHNWGLPGTAETLCPSPGLKGKQHPLALLAQRADSMGSISLYL